MYSYIGGIQNSFNSTLLNLPLLKTTQDNIIQFKTSYFC